MKLQLYVLRQLLVATAFALAGLGFLVFPGIAIQAVHKLGEAGVDALLVFIPLLAMELVPYLLPMGFLLGVVATFGRLSADNEWTAIRMSGTHPLRVLTPPMVLAIALSVGTAYVFHEKAPVWKFAERDFKVRAEESATELLRGGRTELEIGGFYMKAKDNPAPYTFERALLYVPRGGDDEDERGRDSSASDDGVELEDEPARNDDLKIRARRVRFDVGEGRIDVHLEDVLVIKGALNITTERFVLPIDLDELVGRSGAIPSRAKYLPSSALRARLDSPAFQLTDEQRRGYLAEIHKRSAYSVTYILFLLLGFPTGIRLRRGSQLAAYAAAVGYALLYYVLSIRIGKELASSGKVPAWVGGWATTALGAVVGGWATWRTLRR